MLYKYIHEPIGNMDLSMKNNYAHQNCNQCANELPLDCTKREANVLNEDTISCDENESLINVDNISHLCNLSNNATGKRTYSQMKIESVSEGEDENQAEEYNDNREQFMPQQNWVITENSYADRTSTPFMTTSELMPPPIAQDSTTPHPYEDNLSTPLLPPNDCMPTSSAFRPYSPYIYADRSPPVLSATNYDMPQACIPYAFADRSPPALSATNYDMSRAYTPYQYTNRSPSALTATNDAMPSESPYPTTPYPFVGYPSTAMVPMNEIMPPPPSTSPPYGPYYGNPYYITYNPMMPMLPMFNMPHEELTLDVYTQILRQQIQAIYLAELAEREYLLNYCNQSYN